MNPDIRRHIVRTYINLRVGMALTAFALPLVLIVGSILDERYAIQGSLSAYYHTPLRNVFVGALVSVGVGLYLYKGFIKRENLLLNVAGVLAIGVAFLPAGVPAEILRAESLWLPREPFSSPRLHAVLGVLFFAVLAYVCIVCSKSTVKLIRNEQRQAMFRKLYTLYGVLMLIAPVSAASLSFLAVPDTTILVAETVALWVFGAFWLTKSRELNRKASVLELELIDDPVSGGIVSSKPAQPAT